MYTRHAMMIPLRDGVCLASDLYLPERSGRWPLILFRTPYGRAQLPDHPPYGPVGYWLERGYALCAQDVRGTGDSQGQLGLGGDREFEDGEDVIRYLARQDFCNGRIGMFGLSFPGFVQNAAAAQAPEALRAICPFMCPALHPFGAHRPQVLHMEHLMWAYGQLLAFPETYLPDPAVRARLLPALQENARHLPQLLLELPLCSCPAAAYPEVALLGEYRSLLAGIGEEAYWKRMHMPIDFRQVRAAMLFGTGWLDAAREWTIESYLAARKESRAPVRLLIGPWAHDERLKHEIDGVDFGTAASGEGQDVRGMMLRWFDRCLRDQPAEPFPRRVRYFMRGSNTWHDADEWPPEQAVLQPFYLCADGALRPQPDHSVQRLAYTADPADPTPSAIVDAAGRTLNADWSQVSRRQDVLCFRSVPLTRPLRVAGTAQVSLYAATDVPDTDFVCRVLDVDAQGRETALCVGMLRASVRHGGFQRVWLQPGRVERYAFDAGNLANEFQPGHCVEIQICSFLYPTCDRNLHTVSPIGEGCYGVPAHQQVFAGGSVPSVIYLPVLPDGFA